jgi:hypothetical protein
LVSESEFRIQIENQNSDSDSESESRIGSGFRIRIQNPNSESGLIVRIQNIDAKKIFAPPHIGLFGENLEKKLEKFSKI